MSGRRVCRALAFVAILGVSTSAAAQTQSGAEEKIRLAVIKELQDHKLRKSSTVVIVKGTIVTIGGQLESAWEKTETIRRALTVKGVTEVASDLTIIQAENDQVISDEVTKRVLRYNRFTVYDDISGLVRNGVVTLSGWVTDGAKAKDLGERAGSIRGVQELINNLRVYPPMQGDDRIRVEIARRIFLDPDFAMYANQPNPPIHIIVVYGRVTLKGNVQSNIDKMKIDSIARGVPDAMSVDNQIHADR